MFSVYFLLHPSITTYSFHITILHRSSAEVTPCHYQRFDAILCYASSSITNDTCNRIENEVN